MALVILVTVDTVAKVVTGMLESSGVESRCVKPTVVTLVTVVSLVTVVTMVSLLTVVTVVSLVTAVTVVTVVTLVTVVDCGVTSDSSDSH